MFQEAYRFEVNGLAVGRVERDEQFTAGLGFYHNEYQIQYILGGERYFFFEGVCYRMGEGCMALIDKDMIAKTCIIGGSYHDRLLLEMKKDPFEALFAGLGMDLSSFFREHHGVYAISLGSAAAGCFSRIDELARGQGREKEARLKLQVLDLLSSASLWEGDKCEKSNVLTNSAEKQKRVHEVADYIAEHYAEDCSVDELSKRFFMSKSYLCRVFREVTNFTISEYVNLYRIAESKTLLLEDNRTVAEVAAMLGYDSLTYFERVFKKNLSLTPLQYRKKNRK